MAWTRYTRGRRVRVGGRRLLVALLVTWPVMPASLVRSRFVLRLELLLLSLWLRLLLLRPVWLLGRVFVDEGDGATLAPWRSRRRCERGWTWMVLGLVAGACASVRQAREGVAAWGRAMAMADEMW